MFINGLPSCATLNGLPEGDVCILFKGNPIAYAIVAFREAGSINFSSVALIYLRRPTKF